MITVNNENNVDAEIAAMKDAIGAQNDAQLAEFIGLSRTAVSLWRKRNSIPDSARRKVATLSRYGKFARQMDERRIELGHQLLYEGLCLALALAPAVDTIATKRFPATFYGGILRQYASFFREIELACAEEVAARLKELPEGQNAADAMASLIQDDHAALYERILHRAHLWREGEAG